MFFFRSKQNRSRVTGEIDDAVLTLSEPEAARIEWRLDRKPTRYFLAIALLTIMILAGRLVYLNFWRGDYYGEIARNNSVRSIVLTAPRGIISDRFGEPLVKNIPSLDGIVIPGALPKDADERQRVLDTIEKIFQPSTALWRSTLDAGTLSSTKAVLIKEDLTQEEAIMYYSQSHRLPGISIQKSVRREYINGPIFSPVIGYEGKIQKEELRDHPEYLFTDSIGKQGVEKVYESELRGVHGREVAEVDSLGRVKKELGIIPPNQGKDIRLTLDKELTEKIYTTMADWFMANNLTAGAAIALDPRSGAIRALVSYPGYDNNLFSGGITSDEYAQLIENPAKPLFNRAIAGEYPPGSTLKPVIAVAALAERIITPATMIESRGGISVGKFFFGDWKAHGFTDLRRAIAVSSDVYFYTLGGGYGGISGLGMERMKKYENLFGYGYQTGIDLPGEASGFIPDPAWKKDVIGEPWRLGDDYNASIGQGFITATPLQIVNSIATIANGGTRYTPHVREGEIHNERLSIAPEILRVIQEGMRETVTEGTAQMLQTLPVAVAGKTGTAQYGNEEKTYGWFVSYGPYENPELALIILVEGQPKESTYHAVPITKSIFEWYVSRKNKP